MKMREYYEKLKTLVEDSPSVLDMDVVYSKDDEGNAYLPVNYGPTPGYYNEYDREFYKTITLEELEDGVLDRRTHAVCIN